MRLIAAHRLLIGTAIVFGLVFAIREVLDYRATGEVRALVIAVVSLVVSAALLYYLKNLKRFIG